MRAPKHPDDLYPFILPWAKEGILSQDSSLSIRVGNKVYINPKTKNFLLWAKAKSAKPWIQVSLEEVTKPDSAHEDLPYHLAIYRARPECNAIVHSFQENIQTCSLAGETVKPFLDDMAQIVGPDVPVIPSTLPIDKLLPLLVKKMKGRNAVLLQGMGAFLAHETIDDLHAVCHVFEKACKSFIEARILGGGKAVPWFEARAIRFVYQRKYSKQAAKNRQT
ncbi:class II aldolase/adducin N-terminal domain protein [Leptospira ryugenii]|uniref:Class II aldolase/adducin N-terminal domain protein n=1 Tax=Leptospira ryugenii TaxID=1917863 RepID=A0A2P2E1E8_9LEPT|nr:class II aldolase/adducin family protein [Leptospira ryugenii]GBF50616.1 class II aldolase/adducin N-terminal domain protein [Leptospira ryugenii]